jgi:hypothetical protein
MTVNAGAPDAAVSRFAPYAVYTILNSDTLRKMARKKTPHSTRETKRWVTGGLVFNEARRQGQEMVILYADANHCSKLLYWGRITDLNVTSDGTHYTVADLTPVSLRRTQELVLKSTNACIAKGFIRPYAIVRTPPYIDQHADLNREGKQLGTDATTGRFKPGKIGRPQRRGEITLFSFGYWGCGSATRDLVKAIDTAEALRGFEPPLWVDVRISRSVRAAGFRDGEFADLLESRYVWMPELGNKRVQDRRKGIKIQNPAAAKDLLKLALDNPKCRVIFFCACEHPAFCHRKHVGKLLLKYAKEAKAPIRVIEWPGGEPDSATIDVSPATLRKIGRDAVKSLPIPLWMTVGDATALPWGTIATMQAGTSRARVLIGPASFNAAGSHLRVFPDEAGTRANSKVFRAEFGYSKLR